jgi:hypothetical protein
MAIVDPAKYCLFAEMRKEFRRGGTDYPELEEGIYQIRTIGGERKIVRCDFYNYVITHTEAQQARRELFADAVLSWQNLTEEQKNSYNERAKYLQMSGYNLYLKKYLKNET